MKKSELRQIIREAIKEILNETDRVTLSSFKKYKLNDDLPKQFVKRFNKTKDIIFTTDNEAHVLDRSGALNWDVTNKPKNIGCVKFVYAGYEGVFYSIDDYRKLLRGIYYGTKPRIKPLLNIK